MISNYIRKEDEVTEKVQAIYTVQSGNAKDFEVKCGKYYEEGFKLLKMNTFLGSRPPPSGARLAVNTDADVVWTAVFTSLE